jgi:hypothetical protein
VQPIAVVELPESFRDVVERIGRRQPPLSARWLSSQDQEKLLEKVVSLDCNKGAMHFGKIFPESLKKRSASHHKVEKSATHIKPFLSTLHF